MKTVTPAKKTFRSTAKGFLGGISKDLGAKPNFIAQVHGKLFSKK